MSIHFYNYKPDTCECLICQRYDDVNDLWSYVESYDSPRGQVFTTRRCEVHKDITDIDELFDTIYGNVASEQKRKNRTEKHLLEISSLNLSDTNSDGAKVWKEGIEYKWNFTGNGKDRILEMIVNGINLTTPQKTSLQTLLNTEFGIGKVVVK